MPDETKQDPIRQRVQEIRGFYTHLIIYAVVNAGLAVINALTGPPWWVLWPVIGWGIGLLIHATTVFLVNRIFGPEWEQKKIDQLAHRH